MRTSVLAGLGAYVPPRALTNAELCGRRPLGDEWIRERIGVASRRIADGEATVDLAVRAGRHALTAAGASGADAVLLATTSPDRLLPAGAPEVAARLGLGTVPAFDLAAGCSGFLYGLCVASAMITGGTCDSVLVVGSDVFSAFLDPQDWLMSAIFGDGAGAVLLRAGAAGTAGGPGVFGPFDLGSDGSQADLLEVPGGGSRARKRRSAERDGEEASPYFRMDGPAVLKQAVVGMCDSLTRALDRAGWSLGELDVVVAHQANQRILDGITDELGLAPGQVLSHIGTYGNTAAASVPVLLAQAAAAGKLVPGQRVALTAFGAGLAWGSTTLVWPGVRAVTEGDG
ncbi:beta-ketoacyl-ACP synthase III [Streptomyces spororaveus]|uniref:3-oxoacyl-[acyl-carrier-protein] synthase 3 n=1 Tax=Streptomyces spororaveus TaxID=284039 RepID=A0ABQ3T593_9ACTN|nr:MULTISPECIES: beta-ketoacyl-ACP synthase 3 [Streptomyces]MCX5308710.1 beta-ketoacyl-ACP synthase 3 [Streptomyces sp. NBC_00160]GHI75567.1 3-oxoacyl-[acyl-carrier-protein] synthase 3 [Streptomyces spororaveus]